MRSLSLILQQNFCTAVPRATSVSECTDAFFFLLHLAILELLKSEVILGVSPLFRMAQFCVDAHWCDPLGLCLVTNPALGTSAKSSVSLHPSSPKHSVMEDIGGIGFEWAKSVLTWTNCSLMGCKTTHEKCVNFVLGVLAATHAYVIDGSPSKANFLIQLGDIHCSVGNSVLWGLTAVEVHWCPVWFIPQSHHNFFTSC